MVTYTCEECGYEAYQEVTGRSFMPMDKCKGPKCVQYNNNAKLLMQVPTRHPARGERASCVLDSTYKAIAYL